VIDAGITTGLSYYYWLAVDSDTTNDYVFGPYILKWHTIYSPIILTGRVGMFAALPLIYNPRQ
jgi:hypothetical protein